MNSRTSLHRDAEDAIIQAIWEGGDKPRTELTEAYRRHIAGRIVDALLKDPRLLARMAVKAENDERND